MVWNEKCSGRVSEKHDHFLTAVITNSLRTSGKHCAALNQIQHIGFVISIAHLGFQSSLSLNRQIAKPTFQTQSSAACNATCKSSEDPVTKGWPTKKQKLNFAWHRFAYDARCNLTETWLDRPRETCCKWISKYTACKTSDTRTIQWPNRPPPFEFIKRTYLPREREGGQKGNLVHLINQRLIILWAWYKTPTRASFGIIGDSKSGMTSW